MVEEFIPLYHMVASLYLDWGEDDPEVGTKFRNIGEESAESGVTAEGRIIETRRPKTGW